MEKHPERLSEGVVRGGGEITPWNAGDAVGAAVDVCRELNIPLAPSIKARLGRGAKALLSAGFEPQIVVAAMVAAVQTGWFGSVETIAQELVVAQSGNRRSPEEYRRALAETSRLLARSESQVWQTLRDEVTRQAEEGDRG